MAWRCHGVTVNIFLGSAFKVPPSIFKAVYCIWLLSLWHSLVATPRKQCSLRPTKHSTSAFWAQTCFRSRFWLLMRIKQMALTLNVNIENPLLISCDKIIEPVEVSTEWDQFLTQVNTLLWELVRGYIYEFTFII